jgi:hypothetical protein
VEQDTVYFFVKNMTHILGNHFGIVKPWYLPLDFIFARKIRRYGLSLCVVRNSVCPNVYGLPVSVKNNKVIKVCN